MRPAVVFRAAQAIARAAGAAAVAALAACTGPAPAPAPAPDVVTVRAALTSNVVVTVVDNTGAPQVDVEVMPYIDGWGFSGSDWTNAQGQVTFTLDEGEYKFGTPGFGSGFFFWSGSAGHCVTPSCAAAGITTYPPVVVTVTDGGGNPEVDLQVAAVNASDEYENIVWTDEQGHATISVSPGSFYFESQVGGMFLTSGSPGHCQVPGCTAAAITVRRVAVTVVNAAGVPQPDLQVVTWDEGGQIAWEWTDANGVATIALPAGDFHFTTQIDEASYSSGEPLHCHVGAGCTTAQIVVAGPIAVTVVDGQGQPIADQTVVAEPAGSGYEIYEETGAAGQATFTLTAGSWRFRANCGGEVFWSGNAGSCVVPSSCAAATITMICGACTGQPNGTACNDANPCTQTDTCQAGVCVGANSITCGGDQCRDAGACNIQTGACMNPPKANGTACNDSNACTQTDACQAGTCTGANPITCTASDQCHAVGTCNPATGTCSNPAKPDGTTCNDGAVCTQSETCQAGGCQASSQHPPILNLTVEDLGKIGGGTYASANDINASGQSVGDGMTASGQFHAFSRNAGGPMVDLGSQLGLPAPNAANAINDAGTIVGYMTQADGGHAFRYNPSGGLEDLGLGAEVGGDGSTFTDFFVYQGSYAREVNAQGQVVGDFTTGGMLHAFRYTDGVGFEDIDPFPEGATHAWGIGASGTVVGSSWVAGTPQTNDVRRFGHAVMFESSAAGLVDLNTLIDPLLGWTLHQAIDIAGDFVVGTGERQGVLRAFRLRLSTGTIDEIAGGWEGRSFANGVNSYGDVVGWGYRDAAETQQAGFVYSDRFGFKNLNDVIDPAGAWDVRTTAAINDAGDLVGWGFLGGNVSAFRIRMPQGQAAVCQARSVCGGGDGDAICLYSDGVVETSPGHFVAVFGYDNPSSVTVQPTVNQVSIDGIPNPNPQPPPPASLSPGTHLGVFLPAFQGDQIISWTVDGQTATASAASPRVSNITPTLQGVATDSAGVTKAIFTYSMAVSVADVTIPYGSNNSLSNLAGFIASPPEKPPLTFTSAAHAPFVATLGPNQLTWTIVGRSATATSQSTQLPVTTLPDGTRVATLPDGLKVNLDFLPPQEPSPADEPGLTERFYGALAGTLDVTPSGAAVYTVPIVMPPGIAGMAPNLSLVYNSQGNGGLAGQGWELTGQSMIHRCPRTRVQDGLSRPISMNTYEPPPPGITLQNWYEITHDAFCLDGKRMFEREDGTYYLEADDGSIITGHRDAATVRVSPLYFTVLTKKGEKRYYGRNPQARVGFPRVGDWDPDNLNAIWALERVIDAWGNYFDIQYNDGNADFNERGLIVTEIKYTGHLLTNKLDVLNSQEPVPAYQAAFLPTHTIRFGYNDGNRPDVRRMRFADFTLPKVKRLTSITTPLGTYSLSYLPDVNPTLPSRLSRVDYCAAGGSPCLDPLIFEWEGGGYNWAQEERPEVAGQENSYVLPAPIDSPLECNVDWDPSCQPKLPGTQFVDLNGDGRVDFVKSIADANTPNSPQTSLAWLNNGHGWTAAPNFALPAGLVNASGRAIGTSFADMNGDGLLDLVTRQNVHCMCNGAPIANCSSPSACSTTDGGDGLFYPDRKPVVYYNRRNGWELDPGLLGSPVNASPAGASTYPEDIWHNIDFTSGLDHIADMNGDGRPDLVRVAPGGDGDFDPHQVSVLLNTPGGWVRLDDSIYRSPVLFTQSLQHVRPVHFADLNRDGLADMVTLHGAAGLMNIGSSVEAGGHWGRATAAEVFLSAGNYNAPTGTRFVGDVDGDGYHDSVTLYTRLGATNNPLVSPIVDTGVFFSASGRNYTTAGADGYLASLQPFEPPHDTQHSWANFAMTDLNGDGLADMVMGTPLYHSNTQFTGNPQVPIFVNNSGNVLINTGANWTPYNPGLTVLPVPVVPVQIDTPTGGIFDSSNGAAFVDLNGDGITDLVQNTSHGNIQRTWLNTFKPPIINKFPNGLAQKSEVTYKVITMAEAQGTYSDTSDLAAGTTYMAVPVRVAASVSKDDGLGTGSLATTTYHYTALRGSATGRGPQGFRSVLATDQRSGIAVSTTYSQHFPYTGLPTVVSKFRFGQPSGTPITETRTVYCDTVADLGQGPLCSPMSGATSDPPATSRFIYPLVVIDKSFPPITGNDEPAVITVESQFRYDQAGNPLRVLVRSRSKTGEMYEKDVVNDYVSTTSIPLRLGKLKKTTVTSQRLLPVGGPSTLVQHVTEFDHARVGFYSDPYSGGTPNDIIALAKRRLEPNADPQDEARAHTEMHTAYDYDGVGNLILTKDCASDFTNCDADPQHVGPAELPFRITIVSYDPAQFSAPPGQGLISSLNYGSGRFPVRSTNAAGHTEYSAYDPINGTLRQRTGPNGITTCYATDPFGRAESETARCGSGAPLKTTTTQFRNTTSEILLAKVIAVTRAPTGEVSWTYADALGRRIASRKRGFDGRFIESASGYDEKGRPDVEAKPHFLGDPVFTVDTVYDQLGRVQSLTQQLGQIANPGTTATSTLVTSYADLITHVDQVVGGKLRRRTETKNALGKAAVITENVYAVEPDEEGAHAATIQYAYDGDGNLRFVTDPGGNVVETRYDVRGRKIKSIDPDLGTWTYVYNGYGDLVSQTDAKNQTTGMTYDVLGRMVTKTDAQGTAQWIYDVEPGGVGRLAFVIGASDSRLNGSCTIPQVTLTVSNRAVRSFKYTTFGELAESSDCTDGGTFVTSYEYDSKGRQSLVRYPDVNGKRLAVGYHYTSLGYLHFLTDDSGDYSVLWQATSTNASDQVVGERMRNGVENSSTRNPATGWLMATSSTAHLDGDKLIQNWGFTYDEAGNLLSRSRADEASPSPSIETFAYDSLNRVRTSRVAVPLEGYDVPESFFYDDLGNLKQKSGHSYVYSSGCMADQRPAGPHAVCTVGGVPYSYDGNGNMTSGGGRTVEYNTLNKPTHMQGEGGSVDFIYGADGHRVVQEAGPQAGRTVYVGLGATGRSLYERTTKSSGTEHVHFIYAGGAHGGNPFALRIVASDGSTMATKYYSFDHLGSVTALSNETGQVATSGSSADVLGYDPWGARRNPDGRAAEPASFNLPPGRREFTGHETIPNLGLVNMNGRVYDSRLGRFLSPDPNVQFAANLQSYNRYSYVLNNPLRATDPTGYLLDESFGVHGLDTMVGAALWIGGSVACAAYGPVTGGATCAAAAFIITGWQTWVMTSQGVSFGMALAVNGFAIAVGAATGYVAGAAGGSFAASLVAGAISGAVSRGVSTVLLGGDLTATDLLSAAAEGAVSAGLAWLMSSSSPSVASEAEAQGEGGGARAAQVERAAVADAQAGNGRRAQHQRAPMTREQAAARYGAIDGNRWPGRRQWVVHYDIPDDVVSDPSFRLVDPRGQQVRGFWINRDLVPMLDDAFHNLQRAGGLGDLDTYNGSFNIRPVRGGQGHSAHSWGIAIDFNAADNPLGARPTMPQRVVNAFTDAGFTWGGNWQRPDGMHFSLGF
jgi:RHS repeat-associated protein